MATTYTASKYLNLTSVVDSGSQLDWGDITKQSVSNDVFDVNDDGNLDQNSDYYVSDGVYFTGYYITHNGQDFAVYYDTVSIFHPYYVPHNGELDDFPTGSGATSNIADNFQDAVVCFLSGTVISTPAGAKKIEFLNKNDKVLSSKGNVKEVRFVFKQCHKHPFINKQKAYPICITKNALGDNLPENDLYISPDHAVMVDGVFTQANALINGISIYQVETMPEEFTYYHIELENHELIMAEGVEAETYIDNVSRETFDNYEEYVALYGEPTEEMNELDMPRAKSVRQLPRKLKEKLHQRAVELFPDKAKDVA